MNFGKGSIAKLVLVVILSILILVVTIYSGIGMTHIKSLSNYSKVSSIRDSYKMALGSFLAALIGLIVLIVVLGAAVYFGQIDNPLVVNTTFFLVIVILAVSGILAAIAAEKLACTSEGNSSYAHKELTISAIIAIIAFVFSLIVAYEFMKKSFKGGSGGFFKEII